MIDTFLDLKRSSEQIRGMRQPVGRRESYLLDRPLGFTYVGPLLENIMSRNAPHSRLDFARPLSLARSSCGLLVCGSILQNSYCEKVSQDFQSFWFRIKGIVSPDWKRLQWIPIERSEEFMVDGTYFYSVLMPSSGISSKKACFGGFSFGSHSANDKLQPQILFHRQLLNPAYRQIG
jgi:hypothetical protein